MSANSDIKVAVIGAGMAGLSAALRLAERKYHVTVFEAKSYMGGQFGSHIHAHSSHIRYEHCYHMLLNWYHNFWQLVRDIGIDFDSHFEARPSFRYMRAGDPNTPMLTNTGSPRYVLRNMFSGVVPAPDMFAYAYSLIDLLAQPMQTDRRLDRYSVNGFLQSRPYATEKVAELHDHTLAKAFASPSYLTSAASYQNLMKFGLRLPEPMMWILKGNSWDYFHEPLLEKLKAVSGRAYNKGTQARLGVLNLRHRVTELGGLTPDKRITQLTYERGSESYDCYLGRKAARENETPAVGSVKWGDFHYVIVAVPPLAATGLVPKDLMIRAAYADESRLSTHRRRSRPVSADTQVSSLGALQLEFPPYPKLHSESMAALDLYFKRKLPNVPREHVILLEAKYGLTFIDNSQVWPGPERTVLNVIATDIGALYNVTEPKDRRDAIIAELNRFLPFDRVHDVDWDNTHFQTNLGDELFINEVGSEQWRPGTRTACPNVFLAGDYCRTPIDVTTIEAAVVSGLQAARAVQDQARQDHGLQAGDARLRPIEIATPEAYSQARMLALKLMLAPAAVAAKTWSWAIERATASPASHPTPAGPAQAPGQAGATSTMEAGVRLLLAPWAMGFDLLQAGWVTARDVARSCWPFPGGR
jgi:zeta-carotene desaturase